VFVCDVFSGVVFTPFALAFTDVKIGDWFYSAVNYAVYSNLFSGTSATTFSPNTAMTRGMFATVLHRLDGTPAVAGDVPLARFPDVPEGKYYSAAVVWAASNGIVTGGGDGKFSPDRAITREEMAVILTNYMDYKGLSFNLTMQYVLFADEDEISGYAKNSLQTLYKLGVISGNGGGGVSPKVAATRAQAAAILQKYAGLQE
jgi:hypothetical protein